MTKNILPLNNGVERIKETKNTPEGNFESGKNFGMQGSDRKELNL